MVVLDEKARVELLRYIRLFCSRSLQVIIQSRRQDSPEGVFRKSNPEPPAQDWFNLNINTHTVLAKDVHKECKFHLSSGLPYDEPLCCQLSIIQGDIAQVVEIWELRVESQKSAESKYSEVYERQCLLLKSLISLTRVLPAYSACRDWSENKFDIKYEIFKKDPDMHLLGESRGSLLVGHVATALGHQWQHQNTALPHLHQAAIIPPRRAHTQIVTHLSRVAIFPRRAFLSQNLRPE